MLDTVTAALCAVATIAAAPGTARVAAPDVAERPVRQLGVVVDLSKRQLDVRMNGELHASYEVAVGQPDHRTPTGEYRLSRVIWNPAWVPPDSDWAEDEERKEPGDPDNPMGRVKIMFDDLLYIHGTTATHTLGEPASHGCIRMRNEDAMALARLVMEHGGTARSDGWYDEVRRNRTEMYEVEVADPPVLRITE